MTFQVSAYAVDGNSQTGNFMRLMLQSATLGSQGVTGHLDCVVSATGPASAGISIAAGSVVVLGAESPYQGSYQGFNVGADTTLTIAPTGGSSRSDMIVVRAEDPTWPGSPWGGPAAGQILFPRVISGVASGAVTPPGGQSCIGLARIDIPASTSAITSAMIHDIRQVCNPQRIMAMQAVAGGSSPVAWTTGTTVIQWPTGASWQVQVPVWATAMVLSWTITELTYHQAGGALKGWVWPVIGSSVTAPVVATPQTLVNMNSSSGPGRHSATGGGNIAIPASIRGTTQTIQFAQQGDGTTTDWLTWETGSGAVITYEFQQLAALA